MNKQTSSVEAPQIALPVKLQGLPGSPYTRKMLAVLRYRHLPYRLILNLPQNPDVPGNGEQRATLPVPKVPLLPTFYLKDGAGKLQAVTDSTPIIRRLEQAFEQRSVIPAHPVARFLNYLLEDYADEWLTRCMFHYRWSYAADINKAGQVLPLYARVDLPDPAWKTYIERFTERQIGRLHVVGSNEMTGAAIEASYQRFLKLMEAHLSGSPFLFGGRPASADFALMGQLTCLTHFDPTPTRLCEQHAPRVYTWVERLEDLSGHEVSDDDWLEPSSLPNSLSELLVEVSRTHMPQLLANAHAVRAGKKEFETRIDGSAWVQPSFPYQLKCLVWIREEFATLSAEDQQIARNILEHAGLLPIIDEAVA